MTITLDLTPDIAQSLLAQAQAKGVSITDYVEQIIAREARQSAPNPAPAGAANPAPTKTASNAALIDILKIQQIQSPELR